MRKGLETRLENGEISIQLIVREYDFTARPIFNEGDITNVLPIVNNVIRPTDGGALFELASSQVNAGNLSNAQELATQSLGIYSQVYGPLHSDVANCYRLMARIHFMAGESVPSMCFQHKAVMICERVLGVDHPDTVAAYSNIALMLHSYKQYELSLSYLEHALQLNLKYHGEGSIQVALNHHLIARGLTFTGDFRSALHHEKITYNIHKEKFGEEHHRTKESAECLEQLTEKAVKMQKQINEITSNFPSSSRSTATGVELPGQWGDVAVMCISNKKTSKSTRTKKKSRNKINGEHDKGTAQ